MIALTGGVGLADLAELTVNGGFSANVDIGLSNPHNLAKLRPLAGDLGNSLFFVSGQMDAEAFVRFKAGFELFGEWIGIDKDWTFAKANIFKFDTSTVAVPPSMQPVPSTPPELATYDAASRSLELNAGVFAGQCGAALASVIDENFIVKRTSKGLEVSAFGYTQVFDQPIDTLYGDMGTGNDTLHVIDESSTTLYLLNGEGGNDVIDVDGNVNVYITGGDGNDKLDGGSGRDFIYVLGGGAENTITVGDGKCQNEPQRPNDSARYRRYGNRNYRQHRRSQRLVVLFL